MAFAVAVVVVFQVGWFTVVLGADDPVQAAWRDWVQFDRTADRVLAGESLYVERFETGDRPEHRDGFYFLYPPFVAWVTVPLAPLPPLATYLACVSVSAISSLLALHLLLVALRVSTERRILAGLGTMASAPWNAAVVLGHFSAALVLPPCLALRAWACGRPFLTGAALGLLLAKPNWGLPVAAFLAIGLRVRMLAGFGVTAAALGLLSMPLGLDAWHAWLHTMQGYRALVTDSTHQWKQATLFASLQWLTGRSGSDSLVSGPWFAMAAAGCAVQAHVWLRLRHREELFPRLLATSLLVVLAFNPYAHFYDALLALPAALLLVLRPAGWSSPRLRHRALIAAAVAWSWMHLQFLVLREGAPALTGIILTVWVGLELADLSRQPRDGGPAHGENPRPSRASSVWSLRTGSAPGAAGRE